MPRQRSANTTDRAPISLEVTTVEDDAGTQLECLQKISDQLSSLLTKIDVLNQNFQDWKDQTITNPVVTNTDENIGQTLVQLTNAIERMPTASQTTPSVTVEGTDNFLEQEARKVKAQLASVWATHLQARRQAFWQALRNRSIADKYDMWKQGDTIVLPQHIQMKDIRGEPEDQRKRRERQVMDNLTADIELLGLRSDSQKAKYQDHDSKMKEEIESKVSGQLRTLVSKLWEEDCQRNEDISKKRWNTRNLPWLAKYEDDFKKTYLNKNPFIKEGEIPEQPSTYAQVTASNRQQNRRRTTISRDVNERQVVNTGRYNQRRREDYSENTRRAPSAERRIPQQRNIPQADTNRVQQRERQTGTYSNRQQARREYAQPDAATTYQPNNPRNNYDNRSHFLEQEQRQNFRP